MLEQPQSHRGTEKTQSHPPTQEKPQITQINADPTQPLLTQRRGAETQRRRESCRRLHRTARSRPSEDGRESLGQETAPKTSFRSNFLAQRPALCERRPRRFTFPFTSWEKCTSLPMREEVRQNRRAMGTSAGEKRGVDGRSHPEAALFSPATGDRPIACCSASNKRKHLAGSAAASLRLCVFAGRVGGRALRSSRFYGVAGWIWVYLCDLWANLGGWAALRLCVSAPLRSFGRAGGSVSSVSLWFFVRRIPGSS